jgi:hypothetical protein
MVRTRFIPIPIVLAIAASMHGVAAMAASVTITSSACASFTAASDGSGNVTVTCDSSTPVPGAPSCTSLTASPASLPVNGGAVALTANGCTAGASFEWTASVSGTGLSAATGVGVTQQSVQAVTATTTFGVTPVLAGVRGAPVSRTVSVESAPTAPPGVIGSCSGFAATRVIEASVPSSGASNNIYTSLKSGGFGPNDALVIAFKAPVDDPNFGISAVTLSGSATAFHSFVLASKPCIFDKADTSAVGGVSQTKPEFTVNMQSTAAATFGKYKLEPGASYYLNISHKAFCVSSACDLQLTFTNPN